MPDPTIDSLVVSLVSDEVSHAALVEIERVKKTLGPFESMAEELQVEIAGDPVELGLSQFNQKLATIRHNANQVAEWLKVAIKEKAAARTRRDSAKVALEEALNLKLAHDTDVKAIAGQQAKLARARDMLSREVRIVAYCEQLYIVVTAYHDSIKLSLDTLKDTKDDLMRQLAVVKQQIAIGEISHPNFPIDGATSSDNPRGSRVQDVEREVAAALSEGSGHVAI